MACYHPAREAGLPPMTETPERAAEERWVQRAQAGEVGAFEELYRQNVGRIYALCLRMAGDAAEAEELTQEAFVRAWEKLPSFGGRSAFSSWLHRLAVNVVLGRWRARGRRRERVVALADAATLSEPRHRPRPRQAVDLERAIRRLPTGARTIFVLHDVEGYRHREIAELTGLKEGTSKAQLHRARRLLREVLES